MTRFHYAGSARHAAGPSLREVGPTPAQSGFTVLELIIAATITVAIMTVVLTAVDLNANITRVQSDVSDLQQSTRVAQRDMQRYVRMAGRGGLPRLPTALPCPDPTSPDPNVCPGALAVIQDATSLQIGGLDVLDHTDVLKVRGAFSSPIFRIDSADTTTFQIVGNTATLQIDGITKSAFTQSLDALHSLVDPDTGTTTPEAILLVGSQGDAVYAVVELTQVQFQTVTLDIQNQARETERAILTLSIAAGVSSHSGDYLKLSSTPGVFPPNLNSVAFASILEEHRFFIRRDFSIPGDPTSPLSPRLARARMLPGTETLHPADGSIDIADNVFDLQIALGIDLDGDGRINIEDGTGTPLATNADEWLWNDPDDNDMLAWNTSPLRHVRLTILGQAQTADRQYIAPAIAAVENHDYSEPAVPTSGGDIAARRYRRRLLQSTVDLRNL